MRKIIYGLVTLGIVFGLSRLIAEPYHLTGDCMEPKYKDGDRCFLNRLAPSIRAYQIGDVVAYKHEDKIWISRIVALEKDSIKITEGKIIVNGSPLEDDALVGRSWPGWKYGKYALDESLLVPLEHVYLLSDKLSAQHDDSRVFGPIHKEAILGLIWSL